MAIYTRTDAALLTPQRLDTYYYQPVFVEHIKKVRSQFKSMMRLGDTFSIIDGTHDSVVTNARQDNKFSVLFLRAQDIGSGYLREPGAFLSQNDHENKCKRSQIRSGDILLNIMASTGEACFYSDSCPTTANANRAVGILRSKNHNLSSHQKRFLVALLSSKIGNIELSRNLKGSIQQRLNLEDIADCEISLIDVFAQTYIGNKVRLAERLRKRSQDLGTVLQQKMQECFRGNSKPRVSNHSRVASHILTPNRLETEFYSPLALWAEEEIRGSQWHYKRLADIAYRIKDGPGGWGVSTSDYVSTGVPVVQAINLIDGECNLTDCIYISPKKHLELASHKVNQNSVLLSVRGTIGRAAVFSSKDYKEANLNATVVTIDCRDDILPHFLAEFLNTEIGKIQSQRMANGAVQQNMNLEETGNNLVVIPPKDFQEKIAYLRLKRLDMKGLSRNLNTAAKLLVEALIEGKVTEEELKTAQEALQRGDREPDQIILSRLTHKGIDIKGEPPLFPDLDALYDAIAQATSDDEEES